MLIKMSTVTYPVFNVKYNAVEKVAEWVMTL